LAHCLLALGHHDAVPGLCQEAMRLAEEAGDKWTKAVAHRALAEALSRLDAPDPEKAEDAIAEAIRILEEIGARPELARTYASHARLLQTRGASELAQERLTHAVSMFRAMGMAWDLERAEHALRDFRG